MKNVIVIGINDAEIGRCFHDAISLKSTNIIVLILKGHKNGGYD